MKGGDGRGSNIRIHAETFAVRLLTTEGGGGDVKSRSREVEDEAGRCGAGRTKTTKREGEKSAVECGMNKK